MLLPIKLWREIFEPEFIVKVTDSFIGCESISCVFCGHRECWCDRKLRHEAWADVNVAKSHDRLIHVVMYSKLKPFASMRRKSVVVHLKNRG